MSANGTAIELRDAGFSYAAAAGAASVHGVSLTQREGECVVVTGPSGCGKTTLTRMVNGLIPAVYAGEAEGAVRVFRRSIADWEMDDLSCAVGSVFQKPPQPVLQPRHHFRDRLRLREHGRPPATR